MNYIFFHKLKDKFKTSNRKESFSKIYFDISAAIFNI